MILESSDRFRFRSLSLYNKRPGWVLPYCLHGCGCAAGFAKVLPFTRVNFTNFVTLYQSTLSIFCYYKFSPLSDPVKQDPILDQFSMITRSYPRVNGLKTKPFPVAHTCIANIREYLPPPNGDKR